MTTTGNRFFHLSLDCPAYGRLQEAEQFFLAGNLNEALAAAQQAWREHPQAADVFRVLAYIHMARGEYPPAATAAYQSVKLDEQHPASYATLTQVYLTFNMLGNAEETIALARGRFPDDAALLVLAADLRFRQHRDTEAAQLAKEALALNPGDNYARALLGAYYLRKKQYPEARAMLAEAVRAYPQRWDYLRDLGISYLHCGQYPEARRSLLRAFRLNSIDLSTKHHLGYALRLSESRAPEYWAISFFFFNAAWFGWLLMILGLLSLLIGAIWLNIEVTATPVVLVLGGLALALLTLSGISMPFRKGGKFEIMLRQAAAREQAEEHREAPRADGADAPSGV